ncbi:NEQ037 [Nanoarchaeum equitans Kin4-M]|uniref:NEQ037 n=1 Tax=Nanoarchaeum equitans (strain Kin4-M) TaxID=228908 RepID=Q74N54_NANEQ|nr:NEQ037 [Nanoarchaeum equitans Kin4-M]
MRPLEFLASLKGKRVKVYLKNGKTIEGLLESSDIHVNLYMKEVKIDEENLKELFVRGDMVLFIAPL